MVFGEKRFRTCEKDFLGREAEAATHFSVELSSKLKTKFAICLSWPDSVQCWTELESRASFHRFKVINANSARKKEDDTSTHMHSTREEAGYAVSEKKL